MNYETMWKELKAELYGMVGSCSTTHPSKAEYEMVLHMMANKELEGMK